MTNAQDSTPAQALNSRRSFPWILALLGAIVSVTAWLALATAERHSAERSFRLKAREQAQAILAQLRSPREILLSVSSFFAASTQIQRDEFQTFTTPILRQYPFIQRLEWIPRVPSAERQRHEAEVRGGELPDYEITEARGTGQPLSAGPRQEYFPVLYRQPAGGHFPALGFDAHSDPTLQVALEQARASGLMTYTAPLRLAREGRPRAGFFALFPHYEPQSRQRLQGFLGAAFRSGEIIDNALVHFDRADVSVFLLDVDAAPGQQLLYSDPKVPPAEALSPLGHAPRQVEDVTLGGRDWRLVMMPSPGYLEGQRTFLPLAVLLSGLIITALLTVLAMEQNRHTSRVEQAVALRTEELRRANLGLSREVAQHEMTEQILRRSELRLRSMVENLPGGAVHVDGENLALNRAAEELTGYTSEELRTLDEWFALLYGDRAEAVRKLYTANRAAGFPARRTVPMVCKGGETRHVVFAGYRDEAAEIWLLHDVTEQRLLEQQLRQAQKMEAIGRLAGGVAHDFNNILASILGYAELLGTTVQEPTQAGYAKQILKGAQRGTALTQRLLTFSRPRESSPEVMDLGELLDEMGDMLQRLIGEHIRLEISPASEACTTLIDPMALQQAVLNLTVNAADAMPDGGSVTLESGLVEVDATEAKTLGLRPGRFVRLTISDTGEGIDEATRERIFEPFFTTKAEGKGTGLGLAMVFGIVQQSDGAITVDSQRGRGTTFQLLLPWVDGKSSEAAAPLEGQSRPSEAATLLLVEDEAILRDLYSGILSAHGYRVLAAEGSARAIELFENADEPVHLLISDVIMPELAGPELARELRSRLPDLPVLLISGYPSEALTGRNAPGEDTPLLRKPFKMRAFLDKIHELLEEASAPA